MSKSINEVVSALEEYASEYRIALYTGPNVDKRCAEHLATKLGVEGEWVYWDGDHEPPIYVPILDRDMIGREEFASYLSSVCQMCTRLGVSIVTGEYDTEDVPDTSGILYCDNTMSGQDMILIGIREGYEKFLE